MTRLEQRFVILQDNIHICKHITQVHRVHIKSKTLQYYVTTLLGSHVNILHATLPYALAFVHQSPYEAVVTEVTEEVLVPYGHESVLEILSLNPNVLMEVLHLPCLRVRIAVGREQTITIEIVVGRVVVVEVATIEIGGNFIT